MTQPVLLSGLPGAMATEVARLVVEAADLSLCETALTSKTHEGETIDIAGQSVRLGLSEAIDRLDLPEGAIAIDYSTPDAVLANIRQLASRGLPMVIGATGFDRDEAARLVREANGLAVIAPNMAIPIVLVQAAAQWLAEQFPGALAGASLTIRESHQQTKRDTSGTAKALVAAAQALGFDFSADQIQRIRDPTQQRDELGVPEEHLAGHALHRYDARCAAGSVQLALEHNVWGRRAYAEGTLHAVRFLADRWSAGARGEAYTMQDVLRGFSSALR